MRGEWIRKPSGDAAVVFIHGILSSGEACWLNSESGCYWPELLIPDEKLSGIGIYVFTYQTDIFSAGYRISDIVDALKEHGALDNLFDVRRIMFVCHSMGGIVARKFVVERAAEFIENGIEIGLFLIASPSLGSEYADWLSPIAKLFKHAQAEVLRFVSANNWLSDLNKEFRNLKESGRPRIVGKELVEDKFVVLKRLWSRQVVPPLSGAYFFGDPYRVPRSDHFSIAKPESAEAIQHRLLLRFAIEFFKPSLPTTLEAAASADWHINRGKKDSTSLPDQRQRTTVEVKAPPVHPSVSISSLPGTNDTFVARESEIKTLDEHWSNPKINVVSVVGWGGIGKSALINEWLARMEINDFRGASHIFGWSFANQGRSDFEESADEFIDNAIREFGVCDEPSGYAFDKPVRLARAIAGQRALLILDGIEAMQFPPGPNGGNIKDPNLSTFLRELQVQNQGLCIISSRQVITELITRRRSTAPVIELDHLCAADGARLLQRLGVHGNNSELELATEEVGGHPLALTLLGGYLRDICNGDIARRQEVKLMEAGGPAEQVLKSYESWFSRNGRSLELTVLRLLGLFDRPARLPELAVLQQRPAIPGLTDSLIEVSEDAWGRCVANLRQIGLLVNNRSHVHGTLNAHPLVREYFGKALRSENVNAWKEGHRRLYQFLITNSKPYPETLDEIIPLYSAIMHGCAAGLYNEALFSVYWERILQKHSFYSIKKLGMLSTDTVSLKNFFDKSWDKPVEYISKKGRSLLLDQAGESLHALGRLSEAWKPMLVLFNDGKQNKKFRDVVVSAITLSELYVSMGDLRSAGRYAQEAVNQADCLSNLFHRQVSRSVQADATHQSGDFVKANELFEAAESIEVMRRPARPLLSSMQGYAYCDLLISLGRIEHAEQHAGQTLKWALEDNALLAAALDFLTLGRIHSYIEFQSVRPDFTRAAEELETSIEYVRRAGAEFRLPCMLLAKAALFRYQKKYAAALVQVEDAMLTSTNHEMRLQEADCYLEYARIYRASGDLQPASANYLKAKRIIGEVGYGRRAKELPTLLPN